MENCLSFVQFDQRTLRVDYSGLCEESCRIMLSTSSWQLQKQEETKMSKFKPTIMICPRYMICVNLHIMVGFVIT